MPGPLVSRPSRLVRMDRIVTGGSRSASSKIERSLETERDGPQTQRSHNMSLSRTLSGPPYTIFDHTAKMFIIASVSVSALISPFGATTFYPVLNVLAEQLNVTPTMVNLSLTTYMVSDCSQPSRLHDAECQSQIAQAIAPAVIAGMSDSSGRRPSFLICFVIFICANIGLALQTNYTALLALRMLQAAGCSATIALSTAVVADIATSAERGKYMGYATAGLLVGPAFGPTIGGVLAQYLGWRSIFWFLVIFTSVLFVIFAFFFPETGRNVVGNGSIPTRGLNRSVLGYVQQKRHRREAAAEEDNDSCLSPPPSQKIRVANPLRTLRLLGEKLSCIILLYNGLFFTGMIVVSSSLPYLLQTGYSLNELHIGLCYIALGIGSLTSTLTMGHVVDWNFRRAARNVGVTISTRKQQDLRDFPIERVRMQVVVPGHVVGTLALLLFGWTMNFRTHLAGPELALFLIGFGTSTSFNLSNTLLVDIHRDQPATATAAVNFVRCLISAGGAAAIIPMCRGMGPGWAFTLLALVYVALLPVVFLLMRRGLTWRKQALTRTEERRWEEPGAGRQGDEETVDKEKAEAQSEGDGRSI